MSKKITVDFEEKLVGTVDIVVDNDASIEDIQYETNGAVMYGDASLMYDKTEINVTAINGEDIDYISNIDKLKDLGIYRDVFEAVKENTSMVDAGVENYINNVLTVNEIIDEWLKWNGIIGYTEKIIRVVNKMYK